MGASNARGPAHKAMRRTSGPNCAFKPRRSRSDTPAAAMNSPQTLRRGNALFSATTTSRPARASSRPAVAPAGPPPMMRTSGRIAPCDEEMAERRRGALGELPAGSARPQARELAAAESGAHAHHRVVARDVVAADEPQQATRRQGKSGALRLARRQRARALGDEGEELLERGVVQVVQEQVGDDDVLPLVRDELERVTGRDA